MESFDTITMQYLAAPMSLNNVTASDALSAPLLPLDNLDHHSNFDAETFAGSEDAAFGAHSSQFHTPQLKRFSSTAYEDPFSDALSAYDQSLPTEANGHDGPSVDGNHKLLSFSVPTFNYTLLDYGYRRTSISLSAQLHGMFFLAESPWVSAGEAAAPPTELTCYRRNLFQITGNVTMPRTLQFIMTEQGEQIPIIGQELTISATESVEGNAVKIISVPWKTPAPHPAVGDDKTEKEPPPLPLDLSNGQDVDSEFVSFPIQWKRLQFRIATANNGRRKELQQHFVVRLKAMATLSTGQRVPLCEVQSGAIIVRGRSPRNFAARKDFPISGGGNSATRKPHMPSQPTRTSTGQSSAPNDTPPQPDRPKTVEVPQIPFQFDPADARVSPDFFDWKIPGGNGGGAMTAVPYGPTSYPMPGAAPYAQSSPDFSRYPTHKPSSAPPAPVTLSLTEDDQPKKSESPADASKKVPKLSPVPPRPPSFGLNMISSPDESADLLYEYFPLGLDDWMPPVDAVYRPHVVHHTNLPRDPKELAVKNRSKRYFAEAEDS